MPKWLFCLFRILQPLRRLLVVCLAVFVPNTLLRQRHPLQLRLPRTTLPTPTDHPPTSAPPRPPPHHFMNPNIPIFDYFNFRLTALYYKHYNSNQKKCSLHLHQSSPPPQLPHLSIQTKTNVTNFVPRSVVNKFKTISVRKEDN